MEALTVEEFKALLKMFFEAGEKRGRYRANVNVRDAKNLMVDGKRKMY